MAALSFEDYFQQIQIDFYRPKDDKERICILELMVNLLHWALIQEKNDMELSVLLDEVGNLYKETERILKNIEYILEKSCNMRIREWSDGVNATIQYAITKRDADVDATIEYIPELSDMLLGYLDFRNQEDREYKKRVIEGIYHYLEPNRKKYTGMICGKISEEFFASVNSFGIRHNSKSQKRIECVKVFL